MSDSGKTYAGGCMCGAVRYEASGEPFSVNHCHCLSCRKHNGGPAKHSLAFRCRRLQPAYGVGCDMLLDLGHHRGCTQSRPDVSDHVPVAGRKQQPLPTASYVLSEDISQIGPQRHGPPGPEALSTIANR